MGRKKRSDSTEAAVEAMAAASSPLQPPAHVHVSEEAMPFWNAIIKTRAKWTDNDLVLAAELARVQYEIEYYREMAKKSLRLMIDGEGGVKISPFHRIISDLVGMQMSLCRNLQVHARATQGESRNQAKRNAVYHEAQGKLAAANSLDALIATPQQMVN